ncbi:MAG TPA: universal stress protein [Actinospica sp.]|jgi:nucleotide-binding universal stress UspA family protein|nr:universal stress protein [Actinospica sp.]
MSTTDAPRRIVVGVDESEAAAAAARWAADEAAAGGFELHLVHGLNFPAQAPIFSAAPEELRARASKAGDELLAHVRDPLAAAHPGLTITAEVAEVSGAEALIELSKGARLVVTGSRGHGGFAGLLLGSVGLKVASHAHCPVVIVR